MITWQNQAKSALRSNTKPPLLHFNSTIITNMTNANHTITSWCSSCHHTQQNSTLFRLECNKTTRRLRSPKPRSIHSYNPPTKRAAFNLRLIFALMKQLLNDQAKPANYTQLPKNPSSLGVVAFCSKCQVAKRSGKMGRTEVTQTTVTLSEAIN